MANGKTPPGLGMLHDDMRYNENRYGKQMAANSAYYENHPNPRSINPSDRKEMVRDIRIYRDVNADELMSGTAGQTRERTKRRVSSDIILFITFLLVVAALGYGAQSFVSGYQEVVVHPGDTVKIPWEVVNDYGFFTNNRTVPYRVHAEFFSPGGVSWYNDRDVANTTLATNRNLNGTVSVEMPDTLGTYTIVFREYLKVNSSDSIWTSAGRYEVKITVIEAPPVNDNQNNSSQNNSSQNNSSGDGEHEIPGLSFRLNNIKITLLVGAAGVMFVVYLFVKRSEKQIGSTTITPRKNTSGKTASKRTAKKTASKRTAKKTTKRRGENK